MSDPHQEFVEAMRFLSDCVDAGHCSCPQCSAVRRACIAFADMICPDFEEHRQDKGPYGHHACCAVLLREVGLEDSDAEAE